MSRGRYAAALAAGSVAIPPLLFILLAIRPRVPCARLSPAWIWIALGFGWVLGRLAIRWPATRRVRVVAAVGRWSCLAAAALVWYSLAMVLPRAHPPGSEAGRINMLSTIQSAQGAYFSIAEGYGTLECLGRPADCIAGYEGPPFLGTAEIIRLENADDPYRWTFVPGPPVEPAGAGGRVTRLASYAVTAVPRWRMGGACCSFCADSSGRTCYRRSGAPFDTSGARCPEDCRPAASHDYWSH